MERNLEAVDEHADLAFAPRCSMGPKRMSWVENHINATLAPEEQGLAQTKTSGSHGRILAENVRLFLYNLDLSTYWPRRAAPASTPMSWALTYVVLVTCLLVMVAQLRSWLSPEDAPLAVENMNVNVRAMAYAPPIAIKVIHSTPGGTSQSRNMFDKFIDSQGHGRILKVFARRICYGRSKPCDFQNVSDTLTELPLTNCSDPRLLEDFASVASGALCVDFEKVSATQRAKIAVGDHTGLFGTGDRFADPMLQGLYGSPEYRFLEIRLDGDWNSSVEELIRVEVFVALSALDPSQSVVDFNSNTAADIDGTGDAPIAVLKHWGPVLSTQLTPGMRNNEELFLQAFQYKYTERCVFGFKGFCNRKEGSFLTGEYPPPTSSNKVRQRGKMMSVYIRLKSSVTVHHLRRMNKTFMDAIAAMGGKIGLVLVIFNFVARDVLNGLYHKMRRFKRRLREKHMTDDEIRFQNRVHDVVDTLPIDETLRFLLDQSYKQREAMIRQGLLTSGTHVPSKKHLIAFTPIGATCTGPPNGRHGTEVTLKDLPPSAAVAKPCRLGPTAATSVGTATPHTHGGFRDLESGSTT